MANRLTIEVELTRAREICLPTSETIHSLERSADQLQKRVADEVGRNADNYARFNQLDRRLRTAEARFSEASRISCASTAAAGISIAMSFEMSLIGELTLENHVRKSK
jgi:hypothetical protein